MKEVVLGLLGLGNIGGGVWDLIRTYGAEVGKRTGISLRVKKALVLDKAIHGGHEVPDSVLTTDGAEILEDPEIQIVCEFLGGEQPAASMMRRALENGKSVVTANKMALSLHFDELREMAAKTGAGLYYEASVGGAIPIINALQSPLIANHIERIMGIVNGTTNYILTRMASEGADYDTVLKDAQRLGLAEPNPAADVEGMDSAYKLSILASLAFHGRVTYGRVHREGITNITATDIACGADMGYVLKLLAIAKKDGNKVEVRVHPTFVKKDHPLAKVDGSLNAIFIHGKYCNDITLQGRGAGDLPTASAICGDIVDAALCVKPRYPSFKNTVEDEASFAFSDNWNTRAFIRLSAVDRPGVLASIAKTMMEEEVSIATMLQKDVQPDGRVQLIFITHPAPEQSLRRALSRLDASICSLEQMIRVED